MAKEEEKRVHGEQLPINKSIRKEVENTRSNLVTVWLD